MIKLSLDRQIRAQSSMYLYIQPANEGPQSVCFFFRDARAGMATKVLTAFKDLAAQRKKLQPKVLRSPESESNVSADSSSVGQRAP